MPQRYARAGTRNVQVKTPPVRRSAQREGGARQAEDDALSNLHGHIDLVLIDWHMPGIDGFTAARRVRELALVRQPLLIMVTAYGDEIVRARAKDLDGFQFAGTPINDRLYSNAHLATALEKAQSMAVLMDGLGYNAFWMAEHHFQREGTECIPNVLMMALHLTHVTKNLKIGCGFNITPMLHPLRLAEDSRGRDSRVENLAATRRRVAAIHAAAGEVDHDVGGVQFGRPSAECLAVPFDDAPRQGGRAPA